ncbi:MAG: type II secretion system protein GspL [Pseudomonadota bacterium]
MSGVVVIRLGLTPGDVQNWAAFNGGETVMSGESQQLSELAERVVSKFDDNTVVGILPGEQTAMRTLPAPPRQSSKLLSAATLLLEDELALPIDEHHVATARLDDQAQIIAVRRDLVREWIAAFDDAGLTLSVLTPDYSVLGGARDRGVLFLEEDRVTANFGDQAFAVEADLAEPLIAEFLSRDTEVSLGVYSAPGDILERNPHYEHLGSADAGVLLQLAASKAAAGQAINLRQGAFKPPRRKLIDTVRWRRPAAMAAMLALFGLGAVIADGIREGRLAERYESEAQRIHAEAFPQAAGVDMRSHARGVLAGGGGGTSFMALSDVLGKALANHDEVTIDRVRFDVDRSAYVFSIRSVSDAQIDAFRQSLTALGAASSETGGYRRSGAFWVGEMTVSL